MTHEKLQPFKHSGFQGVIGVAREDITPPIGIYARLWGASTHDVAEGVHKPLSLTALTIQRDNAELPLVLVSADLSWWRTPDDEYYVRSAIVEELGIPAANVMVNLTHTHSGASICREDADKPGGHLIAPYLEKVRNALKTATSNALQSARSAVIEWTYGKCTLAVERDLPDPDSDRYLSGFHPNTPADDTLLIGRVSDANSAHIATIINYACHPVTLAYQNRLISPDFVGAMRELVEANTDSALCLFLQGASGELSARDTFTTPDVADSQGRELGYAVLSTLEGMLPFRTQLRFTGIVESGSPLPIWQSEPTYFSENLSAEQIAVTFDLQNMPTLSELDAQIAESTDRFLTERLNRKRRIRRAVGEGATTDMPLWVWRVGDCLFVGHPNEAYNALQTELRAHFAPTPVVVTNVTNGHFGYLPPDHLYSENIYPVWQSPFGKGGLGCLIAEAKKAGDNLLSEESEA
ncbi:MAG: neutral/alkaline non-lysosomal ceramidase N-terminal domain-containing protein [Armatimonadetes bacterium]|nr:neutral/alkaline non-lysosomal ceramidase N-terminal domain-containing protein [Armatimonadota bacterium]